MFDSYFQQRPGHSLDIRNRNMDRNKGLQKEDFIKILANTDPSTKEKDSGKWAFSLLIS